MKNLFLLTILLTACNTSTSNVKDAAIKDVSLVDSKDPDASLTQEEALDAGSPTPCESKCHELYSDVDADDYSDLTCITKCNSGYPDCSL